MAIIADQTEYQKKMRSMRAYFALSDEQRDRYINESVLNKQKVYLKIVSELDAELKMASQNTKLEAVSAGNEFKNAYLEIAEKKKNENIKADEEASNLLLNQLNT